MTHRDIPIPKRLQSRPMDERGYVITFVTQMNNGKPDFRVVNQAAIYCCVVDKLCGLCGQPLEGWNAFIGGEQSVQNRCFSDPPMHEECARYATQVCPYLVNPHAKHSQHEKVAIKYVGSGNVVVESPLAGNKRPDRMAICLTRKFWFETVQIRKVEQDGSSRILQEKVIRIEKPYRIEWF